MNSVDTIARIRREFFVRGRSIKEIARELHVARNTVRKVLNSGETIFSYRRGSQPLPKLGPWKTELDGLLAANAAASARERLTLVQLFEELRGRGYEGDYDAVRRYARVWALETSSAKVDAYVPLSFAPGEAYQFDWSHEVVLMNGLPMTVKVAHVRLCQSRMMFARAYPRINENLVRDLAGGGFVTKQHAIVLIGGTGTGNIHLAIAIAGACIRAGMRGRYFNFVDLVNILEAETRAGRQGQISDWLCCLDFVVLDELGYLPFAQSGGQFVRRENDPPDHFHFRLTPLDQPALRAHLDRGHDQRRLRRMAVGVRRCQDDHGAARPPHPSLRHRHRVRSLMHTSPKGRIQSLPRFDVGRRSSDQPPK